MTRPSPQQVTRILEAISAGDTRAADELLPLVYEELRGMARARMAREKPGQTLQPTALVHEVYLRLLGSEQAGWENRAHFFAAAGEAMRRILIERARRRARLKRGGDPKSVAWEQARNRDDPRSEELLALDQALGRLEEHDLQMGTVVKLRYFAGFTVEETASALGTSARSVNRLWTASRAWLLREMTRDGATGEGNREDLREW